MSNATVSPTLKSAPRSRAGRTMIAAVVAGGLFLAACGSDSSGVAADASTGAATPTTAAMTETTAAMAAGSSDGGSSDGAAADDAMMGAFGPACGAVPATGAGSFAGMAQDTAATAASNNPLLSTLVTAVKAADLVDTLNSEGPFTIFAPTNDAFAAVDPDVLAAVLADKDLLTQVLTYHVIGAEALGADGLADKSIASVEGDELKFGADGTTVNDANVICSNVPVANGTVHIIDQVLLPQVALDAIAAMAPKG